MVFMVYRRSDLLGTIDEAFEKAKKI